MALAKHVKRIGYYLVPEVKIYTKYERWRKLVKKLNLSKDACVRVEWFIFYYTKAKKNASLTIRHFGISSKTFHKWKNLFDEDNLRTLESRNRAPIHVRQKEITPQEESRIVELRKRHIRWGKMKLKRRYEIIHKETISSWKIQYTIQKYKLYFNPSLNLRTQAKKRRSKQKKRVTELKKKEYPGYVIALDTVVIYWNGLKRYILTAIDHTSKVAFARMYTNKSSRNAADFLKRMMYVMDNEVWNTLHDNGSEFHNEFSIAVEELKLGEYWTRNHTPKDNPICERFNGTLRREFLEMGNMNTDTKALNQNLTEWLIEYNFTRPHQTLGYVTPMEYYEKANKLSPMYSSSTVY